MTPEFEAAKQRIETLSAKWAQLMDLGGITIKETFNPNYSEEHHRVIAATEADWEYHQAKIDYYLPAVCAVDDDTLERVIVHERVHAMTAPMESILPAKDSKVCEFAVESLTRAILSVHRGNNE